MTKIWEKALTKTDILCLIRFLLNICNSGSVMWNQIFFSFISKTLQKEYQLSSAGGTRSSPAKHKTSAKGPKMEGDCPSSAKVIEDTTDFI